MKLIFSLLVVICPSYLIGQDFMAYYQGTNSAKRAIIKGDYNTALDEYQTTFEAFDFAFARDTYNALQLACFIENPVRVAYFTRRAIRQGITYDRLKQTSFLQKFITADFFKKIEIEKDSLYEAYQASLNANLRKEIVDMFAEDQAVRERYYKAILFKRKKIGKEWEALNLQQVERIMEITKEYGFPGERLIGIDLGTMHPKIMSSNLSAGMPIVLFIHHYSQPNPSFDNFLLEEVKKGNLYNEHFATICDFQAVFGNGKFPNFGYLAFKKKPMNMPEDKFIEKRASIGLMTIQEYSAFEQKRMVSHLWKRLY